MKHQWWTPQGQHEVYRGCAGKVRYPSRRAARGVVRVMKAQHPETTASLGEYRCRVCHSWHVGRSSRRSQ